MGSALFRMACEEGLIVRVMTAIVIFRESCIWFVSIPALPQDDRVGN